MGDLLPHAAGGEHRREQCQKPWGKPLLKLCLACFCPAGETWQAELINEMSVKEDIAIHQDKLFHQEASAALEQVVGISILGGSQGLATQSHSDVT